MSDENNTPNDEQMINDYRNEAFEEDLERNLKEPLQEINDRYDKMRNNITGPPEQQKQAIADVESGRDKEHRDKKREVEKRLERLTYPERFTDIGSPDDSPKGGAMVPKEKESDREGEQDEGKAATSLTDEFNEKSQSQKDRIADLKTQWRKQWDRGVDRDQDIER